jgi:hypothetical protein
MTWSAFRLCRRARRSLEAPALTGQLSSFTDLPAGGSPICRGGGILCREQRSRTKGGGGETIRRGPLFGTRKLSRDAELSSIGILLECGAALG